jgi:hypothetical protein
MSSISLRPERGHNMTISEAQLETWSRQGATQSAASLYQRIKNALEAAPELYGKAFDVYLQGSYRNSTNIRGDSDVDVVVELQSTFMPNKERLSPLERVLHESAYPQATYPLSSFRADVLRVLRREFPLHQVTEGGKSIKIPRTSNNIPADVVPCLTYRRYSSFVGVGQPGTQCVEGIWFWDTKQNVEVIGYPKQHYDNAVWKHQNTSNWYKPTVRLVKNLRSWMEDKGVLPKDVASSNHIECLVYNVPNNQFGTSYEDTLVNSVNWLLRADRNQFVCVNGQFYLFGAGQWTQEKAAQFLGAVVKTWQTWGQNALLRL